MTYAVTIRTLSLLAFMAFTGWLTAQAPTQEKSPARGVRCPDEYRAVWDAEAKVLRCRREVVSWVVTTCSDKDFATYDVRRGADACGPTEIPGVGKPPGARGIKPVSCATSGYSLVNDRTGLRDRCERIQTVFALPLPAG
ncbi:MAG TPA: hypothetical protein VF042_05625 [Gemmatimonadaceae bacterium]